MADLGMLLREAREKTAAEIAATDLRSSLSQLDSEIVSINATRTALESRVLKSRGLLGVFRRKAVDDHASEVELARLSALVAAMESRRSDDQGRMRDAERAAHGAELARAMLGAEMNRRTSALPCGDSARIRLAELDSQREGLIGERRTAASVSSLAAELLLVADNAQSADDGTDVVYVHLRTASMKQEHFQSILQPNALMTRMLLKDRLEGFRSFEGSAQDALPLQDLASLMIDDVEVDHEVWLHRVKVGLEEALEWGVSEGHLIRKRLTEIDDERLDILTR